MKALQRVVACVIVAGAGVVLTGSPAAAHTGLEPATAAPGSVIELTLTLADEQPAAGTNRVDLQFPQPITVVALPAVPGWTATVVDGEVGGPAGGVTWSGGPAPDDLRLPLTLGPLPTTPGRLQFRAVQTYDNGVVDRWIDDWLAGAPEPDHPGPVLDLVPGGPGSIPPATTTSTTAATTTTVAPTTTTAADPDQAAATEGGDSNRVLPLAIAAVVVMGAAGGGLAYWRTRRTPEGPDT